MSVLSDKYNDANVLVWFAVSLAAINWGLVGAMDFNAVEYVIMTVLGQPAEFVDFALIGIGAVGVYDVLETIGRI
jgi:uncharacterized membrane protein YuzA (DUF378 family)